MRRLAILLLVTLSACVSQEEQLRRQVADYQKSLPELRKQIDKDDAMISAAMEKRQLTPAEQREIEQFITDRREVLRRYDASFVEIQGIYKEMEERGAGGREPTEAEEKELNRKVDDWKNKSEQIKSDFNALDGRRDRVIQILRAAPKK